MVNIQPLDTVANYNAVKVRINDPKAYVTDGIKSDSGIYNAVDMEVNRPQLEFQNSCIYDYPEAKSPVTYEMSGIAPVEVPKALPVPEENLTTTEAEKELAFHGVNFKSAPKEIEITPPEDIKPDVDVTDIADVLLSDDFDAQALMLSDIVKSASDKDKIKPYITTEVFGGLINMVQKDTSALAKPTEAQKEARIHLKENIAAIEKAMKDGVDPKEFKFPYEMSDEDINFAITLTPFEQAERNKPYALVNIAILAKAYADGVEEQTGNVVPLTDLPGASTMVNVLKDNKNPDVKMAAIDGLTYISRPEYKDEILTILSLAAKDENQLIADYAALSALTIK